MTDIQQIARQAARAMKTYDGLDRVADAVAVAVLHRVTEAMTEKLTPALNTGTAFDLLVIVGQTIRELGAAFTPAEPPPQETEMIDKRSTGLYAKFTVTRTDGKSAPGEKHDGCDYFVLDVTHDKHAHAALKAYADSCEGEYPLLARDVRIQAKTQILSGLVAPAEPQTPEPRPFCAKHPKGCGPYQFGLSWAENHVGPELEMNSDAVMFAAAAFDAALLQLPAAPVSSSARPDRQTVEDGFIDKLQAVESLMERTAKGMPEFKRDTELTFRERQFGRALIAAVRQEQADARPARTLEQNVVELREKWASYRRQEPRTFNAESVDETAVARENTLMEIFIRDLDALLSGGAPHGRGVVDG